MKNLAFLFFCFFSLASVLNSQKSPAALTTTLNQHTNEGPPPECFFQLSIDEDETRKVTFRDLSLYHPNSWQWHFGDGYSSSEDDTEHLYLENGTYEVCLTVANESGDDTECEVITVGDIASTTNQQDRIGVSVWLSPNPVKDQLMIQSSEPLEDELKLISTSGHPVVMTLMNGNHNDGYQIDISGLAIGFYWLSGTTKSGKIFTKPLIVN